MSSKNGIVYGIAAFTFWALAPIYFKSVSHIPVMEILAHRVVWSCVFVVILIALSKGFTPLLSALRSPKILLMIALSTVLIAVNWLTFIWAVANEQMVSASLGYFINPLINIVLGMLFFKDRLGLTRKIAVLFCFIAVTVEVISFGRLPWVALTLALSFSFYGLLRKKVGIDSFTGLAIETVMLLPVALVYLLWTGSSTANLLTNPLPTNLLLVAAGPVTMIPLLCFVAAANRISLVTLGFLQYIGPTGMLLLAVLFYREPFELDVMITFALIWFALMILIADSIRTYLRQKAAIKL